MSWDGNTKADAFNVYRSYEENGGWSAWELFATTTDLTCTDTDVENGTKYRYMVRTQVGEDLSAGITGVVIQRLTGPTFTTVNTVSGIKIEWKANEFAAKYYVYRSKNTGTSWTEWKRIITTAATVYSDLDVVNGVQYRYMIRSVNGEYVSGAESGTFILRLSVSSLALTNKTGGIYVEWSANAHAKSYNLYRSEYVNDEWTAWGKPILTTTETNFLDETAVNGVKYRYMVRTVNGEYISGSKTGDILHRLETSTMTLENVSSGIKISWTPNAAASKYFIYRSAYENGAWTAWTKFIVASASTTSYTDYNVTNGVRYRYMVRTSKGEDQSATNASDPLRRLVTPSVKAAATTNGISLTWTANANAGSYQIYRRAYDAATGSYSDWELLATAVKDTTYLDTTATKGVTYQYTARPVNGTDIGAVRASGNVKW